MKLNYDITPQQHEAIIDLYKHGNSSHEIKDILALPHTPRSIQRHIPREGIARSVGDAFRLALKKGRVTYHTSPNKVKRVKLSAKLRYEVLQRDNFKCRLCGATSNDERLQVDHIDENKNNNVIDNLQVLCEDCNKGKYYNSI